MINSKAINKEKIEAMREMMEIQGSDGNWNYDEYMHGMYNGMEFMLSIVEGREPIYREKPDKWKKDMESNLKPVASR